MLEKIKNSLQALKNSEKKSFIFTHIPKCGGTSFRQLIYDSAITCGISEDEMLIPGTPNCNNNYNIEQLDSKQLAQLQKRKLRILACHCEYNVDKDYQLNSAQPYYFVILRDPVKRFISHYNFFNYRHGNNDCKGITLNDLNKEKLDIFLTGWGNLQIKYVVGNKLTKTTPRKQLLEIAKQHIEHHYDSYHLLDDKENISTNLNRSLPNWLRLNDEGLPNKNINKADYQIKPHIMQKIIDAHEEDITFYRYCQALKQTD